MIAEHEKKLLGAFFNANGNESAVGVFDFETVKYEKIIDDSATSFWLADNRRFIFRQRKNRLSRRRDYEKIVELYKPSAYSLQHANVSPDNRTIFFRYLQVDADVWLMGAPRNE